LRTKIINLRRVPAGEGVGYDATFVPKRPSLIGVLAAGYGDGIHRSLGNRGSVLVRGKLAPIVGIISMDVTMIDVTDIEGVEVGDVATLYGTDASGNVLLANRVARSIGTVTSDLLCAVSQRVERSEEHTSELQSLRHLVCRLLLEKKKNKTHKNFIVVRKSISQRTFDPRLVLVVNANTG